jgi:hypothetical protein
MPVTKKAMAIGGGMATILPVLAFLGITQVGDVVPNYMEEETAILQHVAMNRDIYEIKDNALQRRLNYLEEREFDIKFKQTSNPEQERSKAKELLRIEQERLRLKDEQRKLEKDFYRENE